MSKIDIDKFVVSLLNSMELTNKEKRIIHHAIQDQGLRIKDGKIVSIEPDSQRMVSGEAKSEFKEKVDRLVELLKNNPQEQELQAEIHRWFEEPGLTEFEEMIKTIVNSYAQPVGSPKKDTMTDLGARNAAKTLLAIARKEIIKSIDTEAMVEVIKKTIEDNPLGIMASLSIPGAYRMGINDAKNIIATK